MPAKAGIQGQTRYDSIPLSLWGSPRRLASEARWRGERAVQDAPPSFQAKQEAKAQKEG
jgi:hypothetical protein